MYFFCAVAAHREEASSWESSSSSADLAATYAPSVPLGRVGSPDGIAKTVVFLASEDAGFVAGAEIFADGGFAQV